MDVDLGGDVDVLMPEQLLNGIDIGTMSAQVSTIGVPQLVRGQDRHLWVCLVQSVHTPAELLRPAVRTVRLAILVREQIQTVVRQRADQLHRLEVQRQRAVAVPLGRIGGHDTVLECHRPAHAERPLPLVKVRPHQPEQLAAPQTGFQQQRDLRHGVAGERLGKLDLLIGQHLLFVFARRATERAVLRRVLPAQVVLNRALKESIQNRPHFLQPALRTFCFAGEVRLYVRRTNVAQPGRPEIGDQVSLDQTDIGQLVGVDVNKRLLVGAQPLARPVGKAAGGGYKGFAGTSRHLGGYAVFLGLLLGISKAHRAVKRLAQRLAVNVAAERDLVFVAVVLACRFFSRHNNKTPFLSREGVIK